MTSSPPPVWDIMSNLNLHVKRSFYEKLSRVRDNTIIKRIYLLTSKQSTSTTWFSFREGEITASIVHEVLLLKLHCIKIKLQSIYVQRYVVTQRIQKKSKSLE